MVFGKDFAEGAVYCRCSCVAVLSESLLKAIMLMPVMIVVLVWVLVVVIGY